jgi:hypothetical protein
MPPTPWEFAGRLTDRAAFWEWALPDEELIFDLREVTFLSAGTLSSLVPLAMRRPVKLWADPGGQPAQALRRWFLTGGLTDGGQRDDNGAWELVLHVRTPDAPAAVAPRGRSPVQVRGCQPGDPMPARGSVCADCPRRESAHV